MSPWQLQRRHRWPLAFFVWGIAFLLLCAALDLGCVSLESDAEREARLRALDERVRPRVEVRVYGLPLEEWRAQQKDGNE